MVVPSLGVDSDSSALDRLVQLVGDNSLHVRVCAVRAGPLPSITVLCAAKLVGLHPLLGVVTLATTLGLDLSDDL